MYFLFEIIIQNKTGNKMGSCYSGDHVAEDHIHTNTTTRNIKKHNRSTDKV